MKWIYTAVVRPSLSYGAVIWINGLKTKQNITLLNSVQRLANILISGALPSSPGNALNKINDIIPIDNWIEEEALKGTLRLKANGHWIRTRMVNSRGNLTSHTKILDRIRNTIPLSKEDQDSMTTTYKFVVDIPTKEDCKEVEPINYNINCHIDGSNVDDNRTGAGVLINCSHIDSAEEAIHLGNSATVFQAEVFAVGRTASHLIFAETNNKSVDINCDSQAAIMALDNTKIKSKTHPRRSAGTQQTGRKQPGPH